MIAALFNRGPNTMLMISASVVASVSIFYIWSYLIAYFYRVGDTRRLLLCFVLPYIYALYASFRLVRGKLMVLG